MADVISITPAPKAPEPYRPRCRGDCCRAFTICVNTVGSVSPALLKRMGEAWGEYISADPDQQDDVLERWKDNLVPMSHDSDIVADMVVFLGEFTHHPVVGSLVDEGRPAHFYSCKNLQPNGDCGIYEDRPKLCRDFGRFEPCPYPTCACRPLLTGPTESPRER